MALNTIKLNVEDLSAPENGLSAVPQYAFRSFLFLIPSGSISDCTVIHFPLGQPRKAFGFSLDSHCTNNPKGRVHVGSANPASSHEQGTCCPWQSVGHTRCHCLSSRSLDQQKIIICLPSYAFLWFLLPLFRNYYKLELSPGDSMLPQWLLPPISSLRAPSSTIHV